MNCSTINALRALIELEERNNTETSFLYQYEEEFFNYPLGVTVIVPVLNGAKEMLGLLYSLRAQNIDTDQFEVIFSLNGCTDNSAEILRAFSLKSKINCIVIESEDRSISRARNLALKNARFRFTTFADHDDFMSSGYLKNLVNLADYRSVVISNIMRIENLRIGPDYAQQVISDGFAISKIYRADEIDLCYRAYTLNAIKLAPTYMLKRVSYDESLQHCEDIKYWRDLFHAFLPITVKSPGWGDIYYRTVRAGSASRRLANLDEWALPRFKILKIIETALRDQSPGSPSRLFDRKLSQLLRETLAWHGCALPPKPTQ